MRLTLAPKITSILDALVAVFFFWKFTSVGVSMKSLLWHTPIVPKQMLRRPAFILVGCVVGAGVMLIEFGYIGSHWFSPVARLPSTAIGPAAPETGKLADPRLSPTPRRAETKPPAHDAEFGLA